MAGEVEKLTAAQASTTAAQQKAAQLQQELEAAATHATDAQRKLAQAQVKLDEQAVALQAAEAGREEAEKSSLSHAADADAERERRARAEQDLEATAAELVDGERRLAALRTELTEQAAAAETANGLVAELRHSLAQTQSALAQRGLEAEHTAAALAAAHEDLKQAAVKQGEIDRMAAGFREHITLLIGDLEERKATELALEQARREATVEKEKHALLEDDLAKLKLAIVEEKDAANAERGRLTNELDRAKAAADADRERSDEQVRALVADIDALKTEIAEAKKAAASERDQTEQRLRERFSEIATLTKIISEGEAAASKSKAAADAEARTLRAQADNLRAEIDKLRAERTAAEKAAASERAQTEQQINERFSEIAALTKIVGDTEAAGNAKARALEAEAKAKARALEAEGLAKAQALEAEIARAVSRKDEAVDQMRVMLAREMGRTVSALLDESSWRWLPSWLVVRRKMARLRRSKLFDAEWYVSHYRDISDAGVDPLRHYVTQGVSEGREPNRMLAEMKKATTEV